MQPTSKRRNTTPGMGPREPANRRVTIAEMEQEPTPPPVSSVTPSSKRTPTRPFVEVDALAAKTTVRLSDDSAPDSDARRAKRASRPTPIRVDEVGGTAMKIASRASSAPRLAKSASDASKAPLDPQSAYVLSLIDGSLTTTEIADVCGLSRPQLDAILERLKRLGLVTNP